MEPMVQAAQMRQMPQQIITELSLEDERVNQYVWYAGENLPWPEIKGGFIKRCRVTPIVPFPVWERINDVPQDMRKRLRQDWMDKDHTEAQYEINPKGIFESVMAQYGEMGVCELTALQGMKPEDVRALGIDDIFCPWPEDCSIDDMPKSYRVIEDHIRLQLGTLNGNRILKSVGEDMLRSIGKSRKHDEIFVDRVESQKEPIYSNPVFRALSRLDRRRRDRALNDMAEADIAAKNAAAQTSSDNAALVAEMAEQNRLRREELELRREELELNRQMMAKGKPGRSPKASSDA